MKVSQFAKVCGGQPRAVLAGAIAMALAAGARADVKLPAIIGSGMVLQRGVEVPLWGQADAGEEVTVSFAGQSKKTKASADGKWQVKLDALEASKEGRPLTIKGKNSLLLDNVLVGEVWVCSGQSNMQMALMAAQGGRNVAREANQPEIRLFTVDPTSTIQPRSDCPGKWEPCAPEVAEKFSAVGYFFGNALQEALGVPVGLINASWGGQSIETFIPRAALTDAMAWSKSLGARIDREVQFYDPAASQKRYEEALVRWEQSMAAYEQAKKDGSAKKGNPPQKPPAPEKTPGPARLYNGMIAPLVPFAIRGAIWYQGEANRGDGMLYTEKMKALISGWRKAWGQGDFPFLFVQLAPCRYFGNRNNGFEPMAPPDAEVKPSQRFPAVWQAQLEALKIANTGMAMTVDLDGPALHPSRKREVGERLAGWALATVYGEKSGEYSGPLYKDARAEGGAIRVSFGHAGAGLAARDDKEISWLEVAGADRVYHPAKGRIEGAELIVSSEQVRDPQFVRYGWDEIAMPNLMNKEGLPASAFTNEPLPLNDAPYKK